MNKFIYIPKKYLYIDKCNHKRPLLKILRARNKTINPNLRINFLILRPSAEKVDFTGLNYKIDNKIEPKITYKKKIDKEDGNISWRNSIQI